MKRLLYILLLLILLSSCAIRPDEVLSNKEMVSLLVDLHCAEGILQVAGYNYGHESEVEQYYQVILDEHGVTQAQFDSSLVWYTEHPAYFSRVYPKVRKQIQQLVDEAQLNQNRLSDRKLMEAKIRRDSLFLQQEPPRDSIVEHLTWEVHRYYEGTFYQAPEPEPYSVIFAEKE